MSLFVIADLHLAQTMNKPMDIFGKRWENHTQRIYENWQNTVSDEDTVVIAGDVSWGMRIEEAEADFRFLESLPGHKIVLKGNHDYWWQTMKKLTEFRDRVGAYSVDFLFNNAYETEEFILCGTRGWTCPGVDGFSEHDKKIYDREVIRLRFSLEEGRAAGADRIIGVLHYPPTNDRHHKSGFTELMTEYGVETCVYGHLHGKESFKYGLQGMFNGVEYRLVSLDYVEGMPQEV